jgi:hypothetical protein
MAFSDNDQARIHIQFIYEEKKSYLLQNNSRIKKQ